MSVSTQVSPDNNVVTISIRGRFDISSYEEFSSATKSVATAGAKYVLDLSETEYMDSSSLGMLLLLRERVHGENGNISIINATDEVKKILAVANFHRLFSVE
jgi:anti-anti-sigma factor